MLETETKPETLETDRDSQIFYLGSSLETPSLTGPHSVIS